LLWSEISVCYLAADSMEPIVTVSEQEKAILSSSDSDSKSKVGISSVEALC